MKKAFKIAVGGWIGIASWLFAFIALYLGYQWIGGTEGLVIGGAIGKASWIPYLAGVINQWRKGASNEGNN